MKFRTFLTILIALTLMASTGVRAADKSLDTVKIEQITGVKGVMNSEEGVFKVSIPRGDVKVSVDGTPLPPYMGLTSWAAFQFGMGDNAMVMGDIVLFQDEVNPVMSAALDSGLTVTALHNHFFYDEPRVYFMHIGGEGATDALAKGVKAALDAVKQVREAKKKPADSFGAEKLPAKSSID